jgi:hypothetical protein
LGSKLTLKPYRAGLQISHYLGEPLSFNSVPAPRLGVESPSRAMP